MIDGGALEIDFATGFGMKRAEWLQAWESWTWHDLRDRILRLCRTPGPIIGDVEQPSTAAREAYRAIRGRAAHRADPGRGPTDIRA